MAKALQGAFEQNVPETIGVAVSGGGDSMAVLDLLRRWGRATLAVASVNHGLRDAAADEIALVSNYVSEHGLRHDVLDWKWDRGGNLQASAREGRREALRVWARSHGISHVVLGHTADDQAETFLMRLARGSGVDGLAGMAEVRKEGEITWLRPLLSARREDLRSYLRTEKIIWADDPSNEDTTFDRVKARQMMDVLKPLGLTVERLVQTADHMGRERTTLHWAAAEAKAQFAQQSRGDIVLDAAVWSALPQSLAFRLLADALSFVSGQAYRPRFKTLAAVFDAEKVTSLHGCLILKGKNSVTITRELRAVQSEVVAFGSVWDGRWMVRGPDVEGGVVGALGEAGLALCGNWRETGVPRVSLLSSPAVWRGEELIAAPLAGFGEGWYAELINGRDVFG
ncbi:tRNA lysidine(34) synthetase TilS [Shimia isoporae]|nr:tRNA lysidine(34) synthetase TilS [Shimia isoporae]